MRDPGGSDRPEPGSTKRERTLEFLVGREARRVLSDAQLAPDPKRTAEGWERRFITDARRAEEVMALYRELGYEVCADPVRSDELDEGCEECPVVGLLQFRTIYTRKRRGSTS